MIKILNIATIAKYSALFAAVCVLSYCSPKVGDQTAKSAPQEIPAEPETSADFRSMAPEAGPARKIEIGEYASFELKNGLRVIVVENHKIPRISYRLYVDRDATIEGMKAGMTSIAGQMLSRGTTSRTKAQIDESIDFIGANLSTGSQGGFASSLTRHTETVLAIFSDVMLNPSFPEEEFGKVKTQTISGLQANKDDPNAISGNVSNALVYGKGHPYGELTTETSVANITVDDCRNYYETYFAPNISYLVVVGDITPSKAKAEAEKYFGSWERKDVPEHSYTMPPAPEKTAVAFVDKTAAVQSVINIAYPVNLKPGDEDVIPGRVMNTILGSGFSGRLFRNLREDKGYTYGAYSSLDSDEEVGEFSAGASVRNEVTDSAVAEFLYELENMGNSEVTESELELAKNYIAGSFARSLESPQTIANFALNTYLYDLPKDYYATYLEKLEKVSKQDVQAVASRYVTPENAHIIVVGNQDEVSEKLVVFDKNDGKIDFYDIYANKKAAAEAMDANVSGESVIEAYLQAIGGKDKLMNIHSMRTEASMAVEGMGEMILLEHKASSGKYNMSMGMQGMTVMKQVYNGGKGYVEQMGQKQPLEGEMLEKMAEEANLFPEILYLNDNYSIEVKGIDEVGGQEAYKVLVTGPAGSTTEYYSKETGLKLKSVESQDVNGQPQSVITEYRNYKSVDGVQVPYTVMVSGMAPVPLEMKVQNVEVNIEMDPSLFTIE